MPELGNKHECFSCGAKFYDLGRPDPICPKCKANQKDAKRLEAQAESSQAKKRRREEVVRPATDEVEDLIPSPDEDFSDDEIETPEGVEVEPEEDFDDDEE